MLTKLNLPYRGGTGLQARQEQLLFQAEGFRHLQMHKAWTGL